MSSEDLARNLEGLGIAFEGEPLEIARLAFVRDPAWYRATAVPVTKDGMGNWTSSRYRSEPILRSRC